MYGQDTGSQEEVHKKTSCTLWLEDWRCCDFLGTMGEEAVWGSSQGGEEHGRRKYYIGMQPQEGIRTN
jgi:hypothetical protein